MQECATGISIDEGRLKMEHSVVFVNHAIDGYLPAGVSLIGKPNNAAVMDECLIIIGISAPTVSSAFFVGSGAKLSAMRCTVRPAVSDPNMTVINADDGLVGTRGTGTINLVSKSCSVCQNACPVMCKHCMHYYVAVMQQPGTALHAHTL